MFRKLTLLFFLFHSLGAGQEISNISIIEGNSEYLVPSYNFHGSIYISLSQLGQWLYVAHACFVAVDKNI